MKIARISFIPLIVFLASVFSAPVHSRGLPPGTAAPNFRLEKIGGGSLALQQLKGRVAILFYETRETGDQNREFKKTRRNLPGLVIYGVADLSSVPWIGRSIARSAVQKESKAQNVPILLDWEGTFKKAYRIVPDASNLIVIDRGGRIVLHRAGRIPKKDFAKIHAMIEKALKTKG